MASKKAWCQDALTWLKANGHNLGMLTGQDHRALAAIAHLWELHVASDTHGCHAAHVAVIGLLQGGMQPKCRPLARALIAHSMDWGDIERLWPDEPTEENHYSTLPIPFSMSCVRR